MFSQTPPTEWLEVLEAAGVPCGRVQQRETVRADPQVVAERLVGRVAQPGLGRSISSRRSSASAGSRGPGAAPALGADTDDVLEELA